MKRLFFVLCVAVMLFIICGCGDSCKHVFSAATCEVPATCTLCGTTQGSALKHEMAPATCQRPSACTLCGKTEGEALSHTLGEATCTRPATCTVCATAVGAPLEHEFSAATCTTAGRCQSCGAIGEKAKGHTFLPATCEMPKICRDCQVTDGIPLNHKFEIIDCPEPAVCTLCGAKGEPREHIWQEASCKAPATCSTCGKTEGEPLPHDWVQTSCTEPRVCASCGTKTMVGIEHNFIFVSCNLPRECRDCDFVEKVAQGHKWEEATCTLPRRCSQCKIGTGLPLGHSFQDASCDAPKTCIRCKLTEGVALGHNWSFSVRIDPSCGQGADVYSCDKCMQTRREPISPVPNQHHLCDERGACLVCGEEFDVSKMTLIGLFSAVTNGVSHQGLFDSPEATEQNKIYKPVTMAELGLPIIDLNGDLSTVTKNGYVDIPFSYEDASQRFECIAKVKIQGASSAGYPKKNYSIKLYDDDETKHKVTIKESWGKQFKYCLKANWVDYSQARNVVSGQLYGDVIATRSYVDELTDLPSGGAIDGFPCVVYNNGTFLGLYTFNIPKDKWMFDMKDSDEKNQAIVMAVTWNEEVAMRREFPYDPNGNWTGSNSWEIEYASNEDSLVDSNTVWVAESLNRLIRFTLENDGEAFKNGIHDYLDVDKTIDSILHTFFICADDNVSKNILWATYDGVHWFSSVYDMDGTWGMQWNGNISFRDGKRHPISNLGNNVPGTNGYNYQYNLLWEKIYINFYDQLVERYWQLRQSVYTVEHITSRFEAFFNQIPDFVRRAERERWTGVPSQNEDHLAQIIDFTKKRIELLDDILLP